MLRRPSLVSFLTSVVRRAHQWVATSKLMGLILSVVHYLFSNPQSPLLVKMNEETKTATENDDKSSSTEKKETTNIDHPRILSVHFLLLSISLHYFCKALER